MRKLPMVINGKGAELWICIKGLFQSPDSTAEPTETTLSDSPYRTPGTLTFFGGLILFILLIMKNN